MRTRRQFIADLGQAGGLLSTFPALGCAGVERKALATEAGVPASGAYLREFQYADVDLGQGSARAQRDQVQSILLGLNEDSLLRPFRIAANIPAPGYDLGGWYSHPQWVGETFGQWISGLSRYHAATGDIASRDKVARLVAAFLPTVEPTGRIYHWGQGQPGCAYLFDKLVIGMVDASRFAKVDEARLALKMITDAALPHLPAHAFDQLGPEGGKHESYTLSENQLIAWEEGAGNRHRELADRFVYWSFYDPLAAGRNVLSGRHAYSHANALCSAMRLHLVSGNEMFLRAAVNGFRFMEEQSHVTGGWGVDESFLPLKKVMLDWLVENGKKASAGQTLGGALDEFDGHFETVCGSYAHFKLTRYLLRATKDSRYGDSMERVLYNAALGVLPLNKFGKAFYQSNYGRYAKKAYYDGYAGFSEDEWPCCSGTLLQLSSDYHVSIYFEDGDGIYINLYIPSTLRWKQQGLDASLTQISNYPVESAVEFGLELAAPSYFVLRFRIPQWTRQPAIEINGKPFAAELRPGTFAEVRRTWRGGDRIRLRLPMENRLHSIDSKHPNRVALVRGPVVLFAIGFDLPRMDREILLSAGQKAASVPEWTSGPVRFLPWWKIRNEVYTTYHDLQ